MINRQQEKFGSILKEKLIPLLKEQHIHLLYNDALPAIVQEKAREYFLSEVLAFLQPVVLDDGNSFFPQNNKLYFVVNLIDKDEKEKIILLNIPSDELPRFFTVKDGDETYVAFLDDVVKYNLDKVFKDADIKGCYSIKVTRDAELDLQDEYGGDLSEEIEKQLKKRDAGLATRFLHPAGIPLRILQVVIAQLGLQNANSTEGGAYHNLKDLFSFPLNKPGVSYEPWPAVNPAGIMESPTIALYIS